MSTKFAQFREDIKDFQDMTRKFYNKEITVPQYKSFSGGFGSYAQRGGNNSMLRLRLTGGEIDKDKLQFIVDSINEYDIDMTHFTTCESLQLHNLSADTVCELITKAFDAGIITRGGGGDYPRNVMCSPLSGVNCDETFDVLGYAREAADYLLGFVDKVKLPRKLKVCFSNEKEDLVHAAFRDLGFRAKADHTFDVYVAGGLGNNHKKGVLVVENLKPNKVLYCIKTMVDVFTEYGNYENRGKSRTRYLQETLGEEKLKEIFAQKLKENIDKESLDIIVEDNFESEIATDANKFADNEWVVKQRQAGLYAVLYHPIGGKPSKEFFEKVLKMTDDNNNIKIKIMPNEGAYIINLNENEVEKALEITKDGAKTDFEKSTACIGAAICQVGIGDSQELLKNCIERVRKENFANHVLPEIHISGCPSSCSAHQTAAIGFRGGKKKTENGLEDAFACYENGCEKLGELRFGTEVGVMLASDIPEFLVDLGKEVEAHNMTFEQYRNEYPDGLSIIASKYI